MCIWQRPVLYSSLTLLYKEDRQQVAREMSVLRSGREGEPSGGTGRNEIVVGTDGDAQASLSTRSQVQATKDVTSNSGGHFAISYCPSDLDLTR